MQFGFDLARQRGAVLDQLRAGARQEAGQLLFFSTDIAPSQSTVSQVNCQSLGVAATASLLESRRSVLTLLFAATAREAGLTTMLLIPALVSARCSTKAENPAS